MQARGDQSQEVVLTVYFSGTSHSLDQRFLAGLLYENNDENRTQLRMGFPGCGVTNGVTGVLFGSGLKEQCQRVKQQVLDLIRQGKKVKLNCYGHSRGGVAALMLAKILGDFDEDILELNLALLDTVPGNLLTTRKLDFLGQTLANQAIDLSKCRNLKRVLSLYTNEPLPDLAAHAPLFPRYPKKTAVEEDVLPGCHAAVQFQNVFLNGDVNFPNEQAFLTFARVTQFLKKCGTALQFLGKRFFLRFHEEVGIDDPVVFKGIYENQKQMLVSGSRAAHSYRSAQIKTDSQQLYVNKHHQKLMLEQEERNQAGAHYALSIEPPLSPRQSRAERLYPDAELSLLFKKFVPELLKGMSPESLESPKGAIALRLLAETDRREAFEDKEALKNALRNILALSLQRDRNSYSLFSTTTAGYAARALLRQERYRPLAELIQGTASHEVRYRDLRMFVMGENKESYFYAKNRQQTYDILKDSALTQNNLKAYLNRKP